MSVESIDWSPGGASVGEQVDAWSADLVWWSALAAELAQKGFRAKVREDTSTSGWTVWVSEGPLQLRVAPGMYRVRLWASLYVGPECDGSLVLADVPDLRDGAGVPSPGRAADHLVKTHLADLRKLGDCLVARAVARATP